MITSETLAKETSVVFCGVPEINVGSHFVHTPPIANPMSPNPFFVLSIYREDRHVGLTLRGGWLIYKDTATAVCGMRAAAKSKGSFLKNNVIDNEKARHGTMIALASAT